MKKIDVFCVGGGGGAGGHVIVGQYLGGSGGGYTKTALSVAVTPGQAIEVAVGAVGSVFSFSSFNIGGTDGGTSSIGDICSANGGKTNGTENDGWRGGDGGSGGGSYDGEGGIDGSNGKGTYPGVGQGTTTRYFGESNGTLYSPGGNGWGVNVYCNNTVPGSGSGQTYLYFAGSGFGHEAMTGSSGICIIRWGGK